MGICIRVRVGVRVNKGKDKAKGKYQDMNERQRQRKARLYKTRQDKVAARQGETIYGKRTARQDRTRPTSSVKMKLQENITKYRYIPLKFHFDT